MVARLRGEYHVPNTETTLLFEWESSPPGTLSAIRQLLSNALMEVGNIVDVAGDGIVPGGKNEYVAQVRFRRAGRLEGVFLNVWGNWNAHEVQKLLTYQITLDVLRGLWDVIVRPRREQIVTRGAKVVHRGKVVALVIMSYYTPLGPGPA